MIKHSSSMKQEGLLSYTVETLSRRILCYLDKQKEPKSMWSCINAAETNNIVAKKIIKILTKNNSIIEIEIYHTPPTRLKYTITDKGRKLLKLLNEQHEMFSGTVSFD